MSKNYKDFRELLIRSPTKLYEDEMTFNCPRIKNFLRRDLNAFHIGGGPRPHAKTVTIMAEVGNFVLEYRYNISKRVK